MKLSELFDGFPVRPRPRSSGSGAEGFDDIEVTGVEIDSRRVDPGFLFVAVPGDVADGRRFAAQAVEAGAVAILAAPGDPTEHQEAWPDGAPFGGEVPWFETDDPRALAGPLAARAFGHPERDLLLAAVTGTNGKSTVAAMLATLLQAAGRRTALFGTLGYEFEDEKVKADRTTPEATETLHLLSRWRDMGADAAAMEASSHALALHRLDGMTFDVAVWTNLTQDHFDFHETFEGYFAAKRHLFELMKPDGKAVLNVDDEYGRRLAAEMPDAMTYGHRSRKDGPKAKVMAKEIELTESGIHARIETPRGSLRIDSPLLGRYNLENVLATVAAGEALGFDHEVIRKGLAERQPIPGRLEPVDRGQPFPVYVDYAHSPGALESLLRSVAEFSGRRIIVIFGAGGDRDQGKRAPMGRVAGSLADLPILSSDNPRGEDPLAIIRMVEEGIKEAGNANYRIVPDRREAIRRAIAVAGPEHVVLVTGKGHEEVQQIGGQIIPFSDREEIAKALEERFDAATSD